MVMTSLANAAHPGCFSTFRGVAGTVMRTGERVNTDKPREHTSFDAVGEQGKLHADELVLSVLWLNLSWTPGHEHFELRLRGFTAFHSLYRPRTNIPGVTLAVDGCETLVARNLLSVAARDASGKPVAVFQVRPTDFLGAPPYHSGPLGYSKQL
jgi:hypothetical protein